MRTISTVMNKSEVRGRRAGKPDTRGEILAVGRRLFLAEGYQAVTMRRVAADAGVDQALVSYYFGSKKNLFGAAVTASANPADTIARAVEGDLAGLPQRVLHDLLALWDDPVTGAPLTVMLRNLHQDPELADLVRQMLERELVAPVGARLRGVDAEARAAAFCTQIAGLVVTRYVLRLQPVATMTGEEVVRAFGPPLRAALQLARHHDGAATGWRGPVPR